MLVIAITMSSTTKTRSPARWLAPLALVATAVVVASVVSSGLKDSDSAKAPSRTTVSTGAKTQTTSGPKQQFYTVKSGDVLSVIAEKFGVSVTRLEQLNPDVDAQTLRPGVRIRLRR
jgi:LysM repeat protein